MDYLTMCHELVQYIFNNKTINLSQKQRAINFLLIGIYKIQILELIEKYDNLDTIKEKFLEEIIINIKNNIL